jgi:2-hydroxychromene-2-carboxylate isomerase
MKTLAFYFDFISPYAYLTWTQIGALADRHQHEVEPRPVLFAALLDANGQKGPAEIPRKRAYTFRDVARTADRLGVPLAPPASHPFNPLLALRVASADLPKDRKHALVDALFQATWAKGIDVTVAANVQRVTREVGLDGGQLVEWSATPEAKERVKKTTARALDEGAFGVPTMLAEGELFWGLDSLPNLERRLEGKGPIFRGRDDPWASIAPSATRRASRD